MKMARTVKKVVKILVVDDDIYSRQLLKEMLLPYGNPDMAVNGDEAVKIFLMAHDEKEPYDLICLDIMMPVLNGQETLKKIRELEAEKGIHGLKGVKIIMTTALDDNRNILDAFRAGCEGYLVKPLDEDRLDELMEKLGLTY